MTIDRDWIEAHLPHQGRMCLLHAVTQWSDAEVYCTARSHTAPDNPLRNAHGLPICAGIEYAAQAMALHGALLTAIDQPPVMGYLTSVRNVQWWAPRLDDVGLEIIIHATRISGNAAGLLYDFGVFCDDRVLLRGRAGVMTPSP